MFSVPCSEGPARSHHHSAWGHQEFRTRAGHSDPKGVSRWHDARPRLSRMRFWTSCWSVELFISPDRASTFDPPLIGFGRTAAIHICMFLLNYPSPPSGIRSATAALIRAVRLSTAGLPFVRLANIMETWGSGGSPSSMMGDMPPNSTVRQVTPRPACTADRRVDRLGVSSTTR